MKGNLTYNECDPNYANLQEFEKEFGQICIRMEIRTSEIPENLKEYFHNDENLNVYEGIIDSYDEKIGTGVYSDTMETPAGIWMSDGLLPDNIVDLFLLVVTAIVEENENNTLWPVLVFASDKEAMVVFHLYSGVIKRIYFDLL